LHPDCDPHPKGSVPAGTGLSGIEPGVRCGGSGSRRRFRTGASGKVKRIASALKAGSRKLLTEASEVPNSGTEQIISPGLLPVRAAYLPRRGTPSLVIQADAVVLFDRDGCMSRSSGTDARPSPEDPIVCAATSARGRRAHDGRQSRRLQVTNSHGEPREGRKVAGADRSKLDRSGGGSHRNATLMFMAACVPCWRL